MRAPYECRLWRLKKHPAKGVYVPCSERVRQPAKITGLSILGRFTDQNRKKRMCVCECCQSCIAQWVVWWLTCKQAHARQSTKKKRFAPAAKAADVGLFAH